MDRGTPRATDARGTETPLMVEDEAAVLRSTRTTLERAGYGVIAASSGTDALTAHAQHEASVALVLLDPQRQG